MMHIKTCTHNDDPEEIKKNCYTPPLFFFFWFDCLFVCGFFLFVFLNTEYFRHPFVQLIMWPQEDMDGKK